MIDPEKLESQRRALVPLAYVKGKGGRASSCECGRCRKCLKREWMRRWRAGQPKGPPQRKGPKMTLGRRCFCDEPISDKNTTGLCQHCHRSNGRVTRAREGIAA